MRYIYYRTSMEIEDISEDMFKSHHWVSDNALNATTTSIYYCACGAQAGIYLDDFYYSNKKKVKAPISTMDINGSCPYTTDDCLVKDIVE